MCGIVGFMRRTYEAKELSVDSVFDMKKALHVQRHRGPDDTGAILFDDNNKLFEMDDVVKKLQFDFANNYQGMIGFNRLSIKDLSMAGHQPMTTDDSNTVLVFNGEIYNDKELREHLLARGYHFKSNTDTEVILRLYEEYGFEKMIPMLNGMFAIAIMNIKEKTCYLARDRFGIKPLYYSMQDGLLYFASELKSIIQFSSFHRELDVNAFYARLLFSRPSDKVLLKDVDLLKPGYFAISKFGEEIKHIQYFDVNAYERQSEDSISFDDAIDELDLILERVIRRQLVSDVKVGCQVSGGIDSTIVSFYANNANVSNLRDGVSIIDDQGEKGEEKYINIVGDQLQLNMHKYQMDTDYFVNNYEKLVWHNDAPIYQPYFASFHLLMSGAKDHVTVLMSGEGADELAGGYGRFGAGFYYPFLSHLAVSNSGIKSYKSFAEYAVMSDSTIDGGAIIGQEKSQALIDEQIGIFNSYTGSNLTKQLKYELMNRLPESFLRQDKMSMANSIENRVPLVDNEVVDFIMTLPESYLVGFGDKSPCNLSTDIFEWMQGKYIFKELLARKFGYDFVYRKKQIMVFDNKKILNSKEFNKMFYEKIHPTMKKRGLVDANMINGYYRRIETLSKDEFNVMWRAIGLETWCELFLDKY